MADIALFYGHAASNWGDLAINSGLVRLLEDAGHGASELRAVRLHPADRFDRISRESLGGAAVEDIPAGAGSRAEVKELLSLTEFLAAPEEFTRRHRLRAADLIIINAGEHLFESASGEGLRDLIWRILPIVSANRAATPVVVMPSTVGPFRTELGQQLMTLLDRLPVAFAFREPASPELLGSVPLAEKPVVLDPGFFASGLEPREQVPEDPQTVGLVLRLEDYGLRAGSKRSAYVQTKHRANSYRESQAYRTFHRVAQEHLSQGRSLRLIVQTTADRELTEFLLERKIDSIAYETVQTSDGKLPLLTPMSEVAGRMSVQAAAHALESTVGGAGILLGGVPGTPAARVTILGGGISGTEAAKMAVGMRAVVRVLDPDPKRLAYLSDVFGGALDLVMPNRANLAAYVAESDVVIGAVLVPGAKAPKLVSREMIASMRPGSVAVDISIDQGGCFETSRPTTHSDPTYVEEGVVHYCVANIPGAVARTSTYALTAATLPFLVRVAGQGVLGSAAADPALALGLSTIDGALVNSAVAEAHGLAYRDPAELLAAG